MKTTSYLSACFFFFTFLSASSAQPSFQQLANQLKAGDAAGLAQQFDGHVELFLSNAEGHFSKEVAQQKLQQFFQQNRPSSFSIMHKGAARGAESHYCIGKLQTQTGSLRLSIFLKKINGQYLIQEMRAE